MYEVLSIECSPFLVTKLEWLTETRFAPEEVTEFRQPIQVQSHLEMPGILVQLGRIQRT